MEETRNYNIKFIVQNDDAKRRTQETEKGFSNLQAAIVTANQALELSGRVFSGATRAASALFSALDQAQKVEGVTKGFEKLQAQAGLLADNSLAKLRTATQGLVSDFDLMQKANQAAQLGLKPEQLDLYAEAALKLGAAVGRDATSAFDDLITGVGRASPLILDNLGITIKAAEAQQYYADKLGVAVSALTETQKAEAFREAAIDKIIEKSSKLADVQLNAGQSANQLSATVDNLASSFLSALNENEGLAEALQGLTSVINDIDIRAFADGVSAVASALISAATSAAEFAEWLGILKEKSAAFKERDALAESLESQNNLLIEQAVKLKELDGVLEAFAAKQRLVVEAQADNESKITAVTKALSEQQAVYDRSLEKSLGLVGDQKKAINGLKSELAALEDEELQLEIAQKALSAAIRKSVGLLEKKKKVLKPTREELDKVTQATEKLEKQLRDLGRQDAIEQLKKQLEEAAKAGQSADLQPIQDKIADVVKEGLLDGIGDPKIAGDPRVQKAAETVANTLAGDTVKEAVIKGTEFQKEQWQESADFFTDALYNAMTGAAFDAEDIMKRVLAGVAGGFLSQLTGGLGASLGNLQGLGQQIGGGLLSGGLNIPGIGGIGGGGAAVAGAGGLFAQTPVFGPAGASGSIFNGAGSVGSFGPAVGAIGASFVAQNSISGLQNLFSGERLSFGEQASLALPTFGASFLFNGISSAFGGGKGKDQQARDAAFANIFGGDGSRQFTAVGGESFNIRDQSFNVDGSNPLANQAVELTTALGTLFSGGDGKLKDDITGVFANTIAHAENFNEVLLNGQALLGELGFSADEAKNQLTQLFLDGGVGLEEFGAGVAGLNILATDNLIGENSVNDALGILAQNLGPDGKPRVALRALELAFTEMAEVGIDESEEIRSFMLDRFGPDIANTFADLAESGINSFTDFSQLSADQLFALFTQVEAVSGGIEEVLGKSFQSAANTSNKALGSIISKINEVNSAANNIGGQGLTQLQPSPGAGGTPLAGGVDPRTGQKRTSLNRTLGTSA